MNKYTYTKLFSACGHSLFRHSQKLGSQRCPWVVPCVLTVIALCCLAALAHMGYKAEAYVQPLDIKNNIIRMPRSLEQAAPHSTLTTDTSRFIKGQTYRFKATDMVAGNTVTACSSQTSRQSSPLFIRYEGKSIALPGFTYSLKNLVPGGGSQTYLSGISARPGQHQ